MQVELSTTATRMSLALKYLRQKGLQKEYDIRIMCRVMYTRNVRRKVRTLITIMCKYYQSANNILSMVQKWQQQTFLKMVSSMIERFQNQNLNYLQFYLLINQSNIRFKDETERAKYKYLFNDRSTVNKNDLLASFRLQEVILVSHHPQYVVSMKESEADKRHKKYVCFQFWKDYMCKKFGPVHLWLENLCLQKDIRRVKVSRFIQHIERILCHTSHEFCAKNIQGYFDRNQKNQIEMSTFVNTILNTAHKRIKKSLTQKKESLKLNKSQCSYSESLHRKNSYFLLTHRKQISTKKENSLRPYTTFSFSEKNSSPSHRKYSAYKPLKKSRKIVVKPDDYSLSLHTQNNKESISLTFGEKQIII